MDKKAKIKTDIEREFTQHINQIRESVYDFTMLFIRKNDPATFEEHNPLLGNILGIVSRAIDSEHFNKVEALMGKLDKVIDEAVDED